MSFPTGMVMVKSDFEETFTDDFNRANSATVGNDWNDLGGDPAGPWEISGNLLGRNDGGAGVTNQNAVYRDGNIVDQFAACIPMQHGVGPIVRLAGPPGGYLAWCDATRIYLDKSAIGGWTNLTSVLNTVTLGTDELYIEVRDTRVVVTKNGTIVIDTNDSTWLQGHRGVSVNTATGDLHVNDFRCGE